MYKEFEDLMVKHMMRSVNDRYVILNLLLKNYRFLSELVVEGSPSIVGSEVAYKIKKNFGEKQIEYFFDRLKELPLPEWMSNN